MSRVLLDTHTYLWFVFDDPRISEGTVRLMEDPDTEKLLSIASLWEITIKLQLGKLALGMELDDFFRRFVDGADLEVIDIEPTHLLAYGKLPLHHRDPFDRLLIAQAIVLNLPIVTSDPSFRDYGVALRW